MGSEPPPAVLDHTAGDGLFLPVAPGVMERVSPKGKGSGRYFPQAWTLGGDFTPIHWLPVPCLKHSRCPSVLGPSVLGGAYSLGCPLTVHKL